MAFCAERGGAARDVRAPPGAPPAARSAAAQLETFALLLDCSAAAQLETFALLLVRRPPPPASRAASADARGARAGFAFASEGSLWLQGFGQRPGLRPEGVKVCRIEGLSEAPLAAAATRRGAGPACLRCTPGGGRSAAGVGGGALELFGAARSGPRRAPRRAPWRRRVPRSSPTGYWDADCRRR
eukprot:tig00000189_g14319.t1